jgi:transposase InsO family protein
LRAADAPEPRGPRRDRREALHAPALLRFHRALTTRKYRQLFSYRRQKKPGPKGPSREVIAAVVDMKQRNPSWGCPRIAQQITLAFGIPMNKDVLRRILAARYTPKPDAAGPSWLTMLGHAKDSLWSVDLFRCESAILRAYWVLLVMDQCSRRIVGFGVHRGAVDGVGLCRMFNRAIRGQTPPTYLSADHDRLFQFHRWQANLRILDVEEIKTVPYAPLSHPFVERLIGTIRRECLDRTLFWTVADLETKVAGFQRYYNAHRAHAGLGGRPPTSTPSQAGPPGRASVRMVAVYGHGYSYMGFGRVLERPRGPDSPGHGPPQRSTSMRTRARPSLINPSACPAWRDRSMMTPDVCGPGAGPRSTMRTWTDRPFVRLVTRTSVPNG